MTTQTPEALVDVNGISLCYDTFGDPRHPPILLVMGLATQLIHWDDRFCRQLAEQGYWVIRFDNRDIGRSTHLTGLPVPGLTAMMMGHWLGRLPRPPYRLTDMAEDTLALMDALEIEAAHLVGVSMGGMICQCAALHSPHRVLSLTSIMSTTGDRSLPKPTTAMSLKLVRPMPKDEQGFVRQALDLWQTLHGDVYPFEQERISSLVWRARQRSFYPAGILRQLAAIMASPDRTAQLARLNLPALIVHGDQDPLVPLQCGIATAKAIPDARLDIIPGMGHTLPMDIWPRLITGITDIAGRA